MPNPYVLIFKDNIFIFIYNKKSSFKSVFNLIICEILQFENYTVFHSY